MRLSKFLINHKKTVVNASKIVLFIGLLTLGFLFYRDNFLRAPVQSASWFNNDYGYRKSITVNNSQGSTLTDEDILIELDTQTLINNSKLQADCDDLRFVDADDSSSLAYWIEGGCNTTTTQIWVRVPSLPTEGKDIYMYYGNGSAVNAEATWSGNFVLPSTSLSCATGWSRFTALDSRFPYGSATVGTTGGSSTHNHGSVTANSSSIYNDGKAQTVDPTTIGILPSHTHTNLKVDVDDTTILPPYQTVYFCSNSDLNIDSTLPLFFDSTPGVSWTQYSTWNGYFLYGGTTSTTGGAETHTHTTTGGYTTGSASGTNCNRTKHDSGLQQGSYRAHSHTSIAGTTETGSNLPAYLEYPLYTASSISDQPTVMTTASIPLGWTRVSALDSQYIRVASSYNGTSQGNSTHTHSVTITTGTPSPLSGIDQRATGSSMSGVNHYHKGTATSSSASNLPPYYSVIYSKRNTSESITINSEERPVPSAPTITTAEALSTTSIRWKFTDNADDELGFKVYDTSGNLKATCVGENLSYCDETGLSENTAYTRVVVAYNANGNSDDSDFELRVTLVSPPTLGAPSEKTTSSITLTGNGIVNSSLLYFDCTSTSCDTGLNNWVADPFDTATSLSPNTGYTFRVKGRNGNAVETMYSSTSEIYTLAEAPTLSISQANTTTLELTAGNTNNLAAGSSGVIFECTGVSCDSGINDWVTTNTDVVTGLSPNTQYTFKAKARNYDGTETAYSSDLSGYTLSETPTISASDITTTSIQLNLNNGVNMGVGDTGVLFECTGDSCNTGINIWNGTTTDTVTDLQSNTEYIFRAKMRNADGIETGYSETITVRTLSEVPTISTGNITTSSVTLTGGNVTNLTSGSSGIKFECTGDSCNAGINEWINTTTDVVTDLIANTVYTFKVKGRNQSGVETAYSDEATILTLAKIPSLSSSNVTTESLTLNASDVNNLDVGSSGIIFECTSENCNSGINQWISSDTDDVLGLNPNTEYIFRAKSKDQSGIETTYSDNLSVVTLADIPTLNITNITTNSAQLNAENTTNISEGNSGIMFSCEGENCEEGIGDWIKISNDSVTSLSPNTRYSFKVKAKNQGSTETAYSDLEDIVTLTEVPEISSTETTTTSITLSGENIFNIAEGNSGIKFECTGSNCNSGINVWTQSSTATVTGLSPDTEYEFRVIARNQEGVETEYSTVFGVSTDALAVVEEEDTPTEETQDEEESAEETLPVIVNTAEEIKVILIEDEEKILNEEEVEVEGEQKVRVVSTEETESEEEPAEGEFLVADLPILFVQEEQLDWKEAVLETRPSENKTVVKLQEDHGIKGAFTMYIVKGDTNALRICPEAKSLMEVSSTCPQVVELTGSFPQETVVEDADVTVSHAVIGGVEYWIADGLTGTGAEGFIYGLDDDDDKTVDTGDIVESDNNLFIWILVGINALLIGGLILILVLRRRRK